VGVSVQETMDDDRPRRAERAVPLGVRGKGVPELVWTDARTLEVGGDRFVVSVDDAEMRAIESGEGGFFLAKRPSMIESLLRAAPANVRNVVELGIFKGGSVALNDKLFSPDRLVAVDLSPNRVGALDAYIERNSLDDVIRPYYGVSQDDQVALRAILQANFEGHRPLDLVIDDCSHLYEATKASLNVLLPLLRPGGLYVIEDWGWAHWPGEPWQSAQSPFDLREPALTNLIFELSMLQATCPDLISEVRITWTMAFVTRGDDDAHGDFDISTAYKARGRTFKPSV
jgi:predicted O-methyltransferase YrrM